jgi:hypothetical protein
MSLNNNSACASDCCRVKAIWFEFLGIDLDDHICWAGDRCRTFIQFHDEIVIGGTLVAGI